MAGRGPGTSLFGIRTDGSYRTTGRAVPVFLHGAMAPFESSTVSGEDGRFRFRKLSAGTYTVALSTAARGEAV